MSIHGPVYLLRHGETVWNRARRLQGQKDTPLTLRGIRQAEAMGAALQLELDGVVPARFFSSPLGRSHQTAAIVADVTGLDPQSIVLDERLLEVTFGAWDGLNMQELLADHADTWHRRGEDRWRFVPPGGESYEQVGQRVADFLATLEPQRPVVIVAHGAHNRVFRGYWRGLAPEVFLKLDEPQNGFYRLDSGQAEYFIPA